MEDSAQLEARKAGARRTLTALLIIVAALFLGSLAFMVVRGDQKAPEERRVIAVLPVQGSTPEAGAGRYDGFGQYLAAYFGRADPMDLGVFGPASTARLVEAGEEPLALGRTLAPIWFWWRVRLLGTLTSCSWWSCFTLMMAPPSGEASTTSAPTWTEARCCWKWQWR